jgi:hypothetical protein
MINHKLLIAVHNQYGKADVITSKLFSMMTLEKDKNLKTVTKNVNQNHGALIYSLSLLMANAGIMQMVALSRIIQKLVFIIINLLISRKLIKMDVELIHMIKHKMHQDLQKLQYQHQSNNKLFLQK